MTRPLRLLRSGYSDFGGIQISPLPQIMILTDRANGSQWMVWYNSGPPERLSINNDPAKISLYRAQEGFRVYDANDGPLFGKDREFKLILRNGHLGIEYIPFSGHVTDMNGPPPYARNGFALNLMFIDSIDPSKVHLGLTT